MTTLTTILTLIGIICFLLVWVLIQDFQIEQKTRYIDKRRQEDWDKP